MPLSPERTPGGLASPMAQHSPGHLSLQRCVCRHVAATAAAAAWNVGGLLLQLGCSLLRPACTSSCLMPPLSATPHVGAQA